MKPRKAKVVRKNVGCGTQNFLCACGREVTLYFNGGELDARTCECGRMWFLRHRAVDICCEGAT